MNHSQKSTDFTQKENMEENKTHQLSAEKPQGFVLIILPVKIPDLPKTINEFYLSHPPPLLHPVSVCGKQPTDFLSLPLQTAALLWAAETCLFLCEP